MGSKTPIGYIRAPRKDAVLMNLPAAKQEQVYQLAMGEAGMGDHEISAWLRARRWTYRGKLVRASHAQVGRFRRWYSLQRTLRIDREAIRDTLADLAKSDREEILEAIETLRDLGLLHYLRAEIESGDSDKFARIATLVKDKETLTQKVREYEDRIGDAEDELKRSAADGGMSDSALAAFERRTGMRVDRPAKKKTARRKVAKKKK